MIKVFLDANIFFAAAKSPSGGSALILKLAKNKKIKVVTVNYALLEAERNIKNKLSQRFLFLHYQNILDINSEIQLLDSVTIKDIAAFQNILTLKDIPILLGALLSGVEALLTLDKKDFLNNQKLRELKLPFEILNPESFFKKYFN